MLIDCLIKIFICEDVVVKGPTWREIVASPGARVAEYFRGEKYKFSQGGLFYCPNASSQDTSLVPDEHPCKASAESQLLAESKSNARDRVITQIMQDDTGMFHASRIDLLGRVPRLFAWPAVYDTARGGIADGLTFAALLQLRCSDIFAPQVFGLHENCEITCAEFGT